MAERTATYKLDPTPGVWSSRHLDSTPGVNGLEAQPQALAYDPHFDVAAYRHLAQLASSLRPAEFSRLVNQLNTRTRHNLEAMLGERFNTELSQVAYRLIDNHLQSAEHDESFIEVMRRGQEYRRQFGNPRDHAREAAEILGFERIQKILTTMANTSEVKSGRHPDHTSEVREAEVVKFVLVSPRGGPDSDYQHNFFDVYEVVLNDPTNIRMSRYTSRLSYQEFHLAAQKLDPAIPTPIKLTDEFFLAHPLVTEKNLEEILAAFHPQEETMPLAKYQNLLAACRPLIDHYLETLQSTFEVFSGRHPDLTSKVLQMSPHLEGVTTWEVLQTYHALLNFADHLAHPRGGVRAASGLHPGGVTTSEVNMPGGVKYLISRYGSLPVRPVMTSCGRQAGVSTLPTLGLRPFSVADFARLFKTDDEDEDTSDFQCPGTKKDGTPCTYVVRYGSGTRECPECHTKATCG